eukprot:15453191-Alexandrium_andersonii.AAC.1
MLLPSLPVREPLLVRARRGHGPTKPGQLPARHGDLQLRERARARGRACARARTRARTRALSGPRV